MTPLFVEAARPRPLVTESIGDATDTTACDACDGRHEGCDECYRGRVSGYREVGERLDDRGRPYLAFDTVPCTPEQRAAVDAYLASDQECGICGRRVPTTADYPICGPCLGTAKVAGEQAAWARQCKRERLAS